MLFKNIYDTLKIEKTKDISTMTGLTVFHQSLLRDKRAVLAYLYVSLSLSLSLFSIAVDLIEILKKKKKKLNLHTNRRWRLERISQLRWETGRVVPADIKSNMGPSEIEFFQRYDDAPWRRIHAKCKFRSDFVCRTSKGTIH